MNPDNDSPATETTDPRRPVDRLLGNYSEDHRDPRNQLIHRICVPLILWAATALLFLVPVPGALGKPGLWAGLAGAAAGSWYFRLSHVLGVAMIALLAVLIALDLWLYATLGSRLLLWAALAVFVAAWIGQFVGHALEGHRPSFLTDLSYLLVGPLWLMAKALRRSGLTW